LINIITVGRAARTTAIQQSTHIMAQAAAHDPV
jgi:hypothetical protein